MKGTSTLLIAMACFSAGLAQAADLTVPSGQTFTVAAAQSDLRLDHLTLGDGSRINFAPGVTSWRVYAKQVVIGRNVVVDGRGTAGASGENGADRGDDAKDCEDGRAGGNGAAGMVGGKGVDMNLWWGIESLGSLAIQSDGGAGGNGGRGGRGQDGGKVNRCNGPQGGAGGSGGTGGSGGRGGAVVFAYAAGGGKASAALADKISISSRGGAAGLGGTGGGGGAAREGQFQRTPTGDRWFQGGRAGVPGAAGTAGVNGGDGAVDLQPTAATGPAWRDEISTASAPSVAALQQQVQALQASTAVTAPTGETQSVQQLVQQLQRRVDDMEQRLKVLEHR